MEEKEAKRILIFNIRRIIKDKGLKQCAVAEKKRSQHIGG